MWLLLLARVFMSVSRALAGVVVPIYLAVIGFNGFTLGILFGVVAVTSALLSSSVGLLSDRIGRKPFLIFLPLLTALAALAFIFTRNTVLLFVFASLGSFGRGAGAGAGVIGPYQPAEQALLANAVTPRFRTSLFGRVAFASSLGALLGGGPLTALPQLLQNLGLADAQGMNFYHLAFLFMAVCAALAGLVVLPVHDPVTPRAAQIEAKKARRSSRIRFNISGESWSILLRLWTTNSINGLAIGFFGPFITYWFYRRYGVDATTVGWLFSVINLASMVVNLSAASFAARWGLVNTIVISRSLQAILMIPMVLAPNFWLAGFFYLIRMLAQRVGLPLRQSFVMGVVPQEERGTVGALANLPAQVTSAVSPTFAGYLFDSVALALPFEIGAVLQGINTALFFVFFRNLIPPEEQEKRAARTVPPPHSPTSD